jgi:hypothetical protein
MKDTKFKKVDSSKYQLLRSICINWNNKYCNNGTATLSGLRQSYSWKDAYIILCNNVYMSIPYDIFITVWIKRIIDKIIE